MGVACKCSHGNNVSSWLSQQWLRGNLYGNVQQEPKCMTCQKSIVVIAGRAHCFHYLIYSYRHLVWNNNIYSTIEDLKLLFLVCHTTKLTLFILYIYKNNSINYDCNQPCMQRHFYEYHSSVGHCWFLEYVSVTLIDKTDLSDPLKTVYWRRTPCTMATYSLHIEDHVWSKPACFMIIN